MPAEKKLAAVATVLVIGVGSALFFRKDASPSTTSAQTSDELLTTGKLERRLSPTQQLESPIAVQTFRIPVAAAGLGESAPSELPPNNLALSPVGALLKPLDYADAESEQPDLPGTENPTAPVLHQIVDGDTLAKLAQRYLGSADRAREIYESNREALPNPDLLPIGKVLKIPPRAASSRDTANIAQPDSQALPVERTSAAFINTGGQATSGTLMPTGQAFMNTGGQATSDTQGRQPGVNGSASPASFVPPSPAANLPAGPG